MKERKDGEVREGETEGGHNSRIELSLGSHKEAVEWAEARVDWKSMI